MLVNWHRLPKLPRILAQWHGDTAHWSKTWGTCELGDVRNVPPRVLGRIGEPNWNQMDVVSHSKVLCQFVFVPARDGESHQMLRANEGMRCQMFLFSGDVFFFLEIMDHSNLLDLCNWYINIIYFFKVPIYYIYMYIYIIFFDMGLQLTT